ncbi:hypothetical protein ACCAA_670056 [Candidatus Accumulibacter aalborgensis]|uniref:Uncharacterized protein n=1 Tax=Candidatus Accumulibacter aalborgensis TaxID=1860102 RepID=A0A1A8XYK2_9PROT|nr:hypothetical protein ACCAA_670056 [Candidatus Accumulibacter aalborgensis]
MLGRDAYRQVESFASLVAIAFERMRYADVTLMA